MDWQSQLVLIGLITLLAVISPGPDFAVILRNSLQYGRRPGLATAAGIASGVSVHVLYTLLGLGYILAEALWILEGMRYLGAGYLIWLGMSAFRSAKKGHRAAQYAFSPATLSLWIAFRDGAVCNALNPKTALFFIALFSQVVDPSTPMVAQVGLGLFIALAHWLWFSTVAVMLTHERFERLIGQAKGTLERLVGVCLLGLGLKLALTT